MFLGGIFLFSGLMKTLDMNFFVNAIYKIQFISYDLARAISILVTGVELIVGCSLILGLYVRNILKISFLLLFIFILYLSAVLIFKLEVKSCGCFGKLSTQSISVIDIIRNLFILTLVWLLLKNEKYCLIYSFDHLVISKDH